MSITPNQEEDGRPRGHPPTAVQCALALVTAGLAVAAAMLALIGTAQASYRDALPEDGPYLQVPPELTPEATPEPTPELQPAYFLYTVQPGDTVSDIAAVFAISPAYILWNNPDVIYDPNLVLVGEQLLIPSVDGIIYHVKPGDTLPDIAALYQIDVESILTFAPNSLTSSDGVIEGMILILPGAVPPLLPRPPAVVEVTPSEPQAMEPTPTAEESPSFSIGHTYP